MPLSRRAFLAQGGLVVAGLAGCGRETAPIARRPAKLVSMAPLTAPGSPQQDYTRAGNRGFFADTRTRFIRISLDWPQVEPRRGVYDWAALDANVAAAQADGLTVVLSTYRFPHWANGTPAEEDDAYRRATRRDRVASPGGAYRALEFRLPDGRGVDSPFGALMAQVLSRYTVEYLEPVNEPNLLYWPQCGPDGARTVHLAVAEMLATVQELCARVQRPPTLLLPSCSDILTTADNPRYRTPVLSSDPALDFTGLMADALQARGFDQSRAIWSHHNYTDVEDRRWGGRSITQAVRERLRERGWDGSRRLEAEGIATPAVFLTEGGARAGDDIGAQAISVRAALAALSSSPDGDGVATIAQELFYSQIDPADRSNTFDSGLLEPHRPGRPDRYRPAYSAWKAYR